MQYRALQWFIKTIVQNYICPYCNKHVSEDVIDVVWTAGNTLDLDIECKGCGKHSMIKSEIVSIDINELPVSPEQLSQIKATMKKISAPKKEKKTIKDESIVTLNSELRKKNVSIWDLFKTEE